MFLVRTIAVAAWIVAAGTVCALPARAQLSVPADSPSSALVDPTWSPDTKVLYDLEARFAADVAKDGGKAFGRWFAEDAVTLENGQAALVGRSAIIAKNDWTAAQNQLSWKPDGARISPKGDMGFTWGQYTLAYKDHQGEAHTLTGRYFTVWKKQPDGTWKVALDGGNEAPPEAGSCCRVQ